MKCSTGNVAAREPMHGLAAGVVHTCACSVQMLQEIFLTLVGRQGDRDATADTVSSRGGARSQLEDASVLKGLRTDCRWVVSPLEGISTERTHTCRIPSPLIKPGARSAWFESQTLFPRVAYGTPVSNGAEQWRQAKRCLLYFDAVFTACFVRVRRSCRTTCTTPTP